MTARPSLAPVASRCARSARPSERWSASEWPSGAGCPGAEAAVEPFETVYYSRRRTRLESGHASCTILPLSHRAFAHAGETRGCIMWLGYHSSAFGPGSRQVCKQSSMEAQASRSSSRASRKRRQAAVRDSQTWRLAARDLCIYVLYPSTHLFEAGSLHLDGALALEGFRTAWVSHLCAFTTGVGRSGVCKHFQRVGIP